MKLHFSSNYSNLYVPVIIFIIQINDKIDCVIFYLGWPILLIYNKYVQIIIDHYYVCAPGMDWITFIIIMLHFHLGNFCNVYNCEKKIFKAIEFKISLESRRRLA